LNSKPYPTKGFAVREGWHCTAQPVAPHLKLKLASGEKRVWKKVLMEDFEEIQRPENQGGLWYIANKIKILKVKCQKCGEEGINGSPFDLCEICLDEFKQELQFEIEMKSSNYLRKSEEKN